MELKSRFLVFILIFVIAVFSFYQPTKGKEFKQVNLRYGDDPKQTLDLYAPTTDINKEYPVIIYVHGGGWMRGDKSNVTVKPAFFTNKGYLFVSVNYRFAPKVSYDEMANDIASAVKWIYQHAEQYHIDKQKLNLMGHSAGGHLVMLVGTDPNYLERVGLSPDKIKSIVNLDGPIDLVDYIPKNKNYKQVFGSNRRIWAEASPITYADQQHLPPMLLVGPRSNSIVTFVKKARSAGNVIQTFETKTLTHREITKLLGTENGPKEAENMTSVVGRFLETYNLMSAN